MKELKDIVLKKGDIVYLEKDDGYAESTTITAFAGSLASKVFGGYKVTKIDRPHYETIYESPKPILDKKEKDYLENFLRPFRNRVKWIVKYTSYRGDEYYNGRRELLVEFDEEYATLLHSGGGRGKAGHCWFVVDASKLKKIDKEDSNIDKQIEYLEQELAKLKKQKTESKWKFTEDEKAILRNVSEEYKWIARDEDNLLVVYSTIPYKLSCVWDTASVDDLFDFNIFNHLFQCIQFTDEEPCEFRKYLRE